MSKTRRLSDLYVRGQDVVVTETDAKGNVTESIPVYMVKLNPVLHERAYRMASAHRAKFLSISRYPDSADYQAYVSEAYDVGGRDQQIEYVAFTEISEATAVAEEKVSFEEEWSKDNYLQGLKDAWLHDMEKRALEDPEDVEAGRVRDELDRFHKQVDIELTERKELILAQYQSMGEDELLDLAVERMIKMQADFEWGREYRKCQVWLATRDADDHSKSYFASRAEVDELEAPTLRQLEDAYVALSVDPIEVKDSEETATSSPSVAQPKQEGTAVSSTPLVAVQ